MYVYACMYACMIEENRTHDQHTTSTLTEHTTTEKGRTQAKRENLFIYVCLRTMKKSIKKVKKNLEIRKNRRIFVAVIKIGQHYEKENYQANKEGRIFQASAD